MKIIKYFIVFMIAFILCSCSGTNCIKVGGNYEGVEGSLEYCFNQAESKTSGFVTFDGKDEKKRLLSDSEISVVVGELEKSEAKNKVGIMSVEKPETAQESPVAKLRKLLDRLKK